MRMNNLWRMRRVKRTNRDGSITRVQYRATIQNVSYLIEYRKGQGWVAFCRGVQMGGKFITCWRAAEEIYRQTNVCPEWA